MGLLRRLGSYHTLPTANPTCVSRSSYHYPCIVAFGPYNVPEVRLQHFSFIKAPEKHASSAREYPTTDHASNYEQRITFNPYSPSKIGTDTPDTRHVRMCYWYKHEYSCKHVTYALGRFCTAANLVQTPCKKRTIWQTIRMGEDCEECAIPENRGSNTGGYDGVPEQQRKGGLKAKRGKKR